MPRQYRARRLSVWEAGGELSGISATGKIQWESVATGAHPQTGEFDDALPIGGGGPSHGAQLAGVA